MRAIRKRPFQTSTFRMKERTMLRQVAYLLTAVMLFVACSPNDTDASTNPANFENETTVNVDLSTTNKWTKMQVKNTRRILLVISAPPATENTYTFSCKIDARVTRNNGSIISKTLFVLLDSLADKSSENPKTPVSYFHFNELPVDTAAFEFDGDCVPIGRYIVVNGSDVELEVAVDRREGSSGTVIYALNKNEMGSMKCSLKLTLQDSAGQPKVVVPSSIVNMVNMDDLGVVIRTADFRDIDLQQDAVFLKISDCKSL